ESGGTGDDRVGVIAAEKQVAGDAGVIESAVVRRANVKPATGTDAPRPARTGAAVDGDVDRTAGGRGDGERAAVERKVLGIVQAVNRLIARGENDARIGRNVNGDIIGSGGKGVAAP